MRKFTKIRACNRIIQMFVVAAMQQKNVHMMTINDRQSACVVFAKEDIVCMLRCTQYATTAESHAIAYVNDANKYHTANVHYVKTSRSVTHCYMSIVDILRFSSDTCFELSDEAKASRFADMSFTDDVSVVQTLAISQSQSLALVA